MAKPILIGVKYESSHWWFARRSQGNLIALVDEARRKIAQKTKGSR